MHDSLKKLFFITLASIVIPTAISYWLTWVLIGFYKYPAEFGVFTLFGVYGFLVRSLIPSVLSFIIFSKYIGLKTKPWLVVILTLAMMFWLYWLPLFGIAIVCGITGDCL